MIFDIETDALLLEDVTKIHCFAYQMSPKSEVCVTSDYKEMRRLVLTASKLIGHNIILYDLPVLRKILKVDVSAKLIDTLALSWYINPSRVLHGLESYGDFFGIPKPPITDWKNLPLEEYKNRCKEDVKITAKVYSFLRQKLLLVYDTKEQADRLVSYLSFKMSCVELQHRSKWKVNNTLVNTTLDTLQASQEEKIKELVLIMPKVPIMVTKHPPARPYLKTGGLSVSGREWDSLIKKMGLSEAYREPVTYQAGEKEPNPNSTDQVKAWLTSLGWVPETFKYVKDVEKERAIPQLRIDGEEGKELCPSITKMFKKHPFLELLQGLSVIQHRISILEGFRNNQQNGYLIADIGGLTNTLRLKHRVLVNLPGVYKPWGKEIRGSLIAEEGEILCGSDMTSLEDSTKKHYMYPYDPAYVEEMSSDTFDPHLDLAKFAGKVTQDDIDFYVGFKKKSKQKDFIASKEEKEKYKFVDLLRKVYKAANYACIYGVGAPRLARTVEISVKEAKKLIEVYWQRNWSIKQFSEEAEIKTVNNEMWVYNPVSKFYYSLRNKKDVFSTINQSTGVFCFDTWIKYTLKTHRQLVAQFHDEIVKRIPEDFQQSCQTFLLEAIEKTNDQLKLNVKLRIDTQFGKTYADIH